MTFYGLVADMNEITGEMDEQSALEVTGAVLASVMSNLSSKTFLQGLSEFSAALSSGDPEKVQRLMSNTARTGVPFSGLLGQTNPDDTMREARTFLEQIRSRIPGYSETLEPRRNLFGEKIIKAPATAGNRAINPFTVSVDEDNVADELLKLGKGFSMPPERKGTGSLAIDLTDRTAFDNGTGQSPYDFMLESMSKSPPGGGKSLRQALTDLVESPQWEGLGEGTSYNQGGAKWLAASRITAAYRQAAWGRTLAAYPKVAEALGAQAGLKAQGLADSADPALEALLQGGN